MIFENSSSVRSFVMSDSEENSSSPGEGPSLRQDGSDEVMLGEVLGNKCKINIDEPESSYLQDNFKSEYEIDNESTFGAESKPVRHLSQLDCQEQSPDFSDPSHLESGIDFPSDSQFVSIMRVNDEDAENAEPNIETERVVELEKKNKNVTHALGIYKNNVQKSNEILKMQNNKLEDFEFKLEQERSARAEAEKLSDQYKNDLLKAQKEILELKQLNERLTAELSKCRQTPGFVMSNEKTRNPNDRYDTIEKTESIFILSKASENVTDGSTGLDYPSGRSRPDDEPQKPRMIQERPKNWSASELSSVGEGVAAEEMRAPVPCFNPFKAQLPP